MITLAFGRYLPSYLAKQTLLFGAGIKQHNTAHLAFPSPCACQSVVFSHTPCVPDGVCYLGIRWMTNSFPFHVLPGGLTTVF